ncbi:hypothetical protein CAP42_02765 [Acinetobacter indicus]|uniref:hypothetical protein n=1 Tax=Acinetobacter indicus TaxID=756892 RepID=UPI0005F828F0|nr:hypothetical protein [Acinetobacter indicus]KJV45550.1 hypothetical protein VH96_01780 [Acinetobacter indicus]OUY11218.1 hypothetical protein CAP42_02765 [Acinetobacter indicus]
MISISVIQPLAVLYRLGICFGMGYLGSDLIACDLAYFLQAYFPKAESVYLAAFIALIFYICFVIGTFCIQSLKKLSVYGLVPIILLFILSHFTG